MAGNTGLVDCCLLNDVVDLPLAFPQDFNNPTPCWVSKGLESV